MLENIGYKVSRGIYVGWIFKGFSVVEEMEIVCGEGWDGDWFVIIINVVIYVI